MRMTWNTLDEYGGNNGVNSFTIGRYAWIGKQKWFAQRFATVKNENYRKEITGIGGFQC